ncbi:hypothetical protein PanWU01x14_207790 [Parasponia andersonii]|uniref:Uncharacterized protein n=1 Tax=Parasponia andersonii TaxID=3476 RepID=A0A2P5BV65_PARAD|nr:hypothetical protein PanWU01x14_207790 [Parasponia andersonii]
MIWSGEKFLVAASISLMEIIWSEGWNDEISSTDVRPGFGTLVGVGWFGTLVGVGWFGTLVGAGEFGSLVGAGGFGTLVGAGGFGTRSTLQIFSTTAEMIEAAIMPMAKHARMV